MLPEPFVKGLFPRNVDSKCQPAGIGGKDEGEELEEQA